MAQLPIDLPSPTIGSRSRHVMTEIQKLASALIEDIGAGRSLSIPLRMRSTNLAQDIHINPSNPRFPNSFHQSALRFGMAHVFAGGERVSKLI